MSIKQLPLHKRPREKLAELGVKNLTNKELVAIILRTGTSKTSVLKTAGNLLDRTSLKDISDMSVNDLQKVSGIGNAYASSLVAAIELANRVKDDQNISLTQPEQIMQLVEYLKIKKQEHFVCLYVNARYNLLAKRTISIGTIDASLAHPREVFRPGIEMGASYIIIAHNHPSGIPNPSEADLVLTARLVEVGEVIGIRVLDHIIVGSEGWVSLKRMEIM